MNARQKSYISLHIAVFLFGFTAILGALIDMPAYLIVWWRVLITSISLAFLINVAKTLRTLPRRDILAFAGTGVIIALHWLTFYGAVKLSNASICLVCMATASLFTSFLEPLMLKKKFQWHEAGLGLLIIPAMVLIVRNLDFSMYWGIAAGLMSSLLAVIFSIFNKTFVQRASTMQITFIELSSAWLFLTLVLPFLVWNGTFSWTDISPPTQMDWVYLVILALLCTTLAYVLSLYALKELSVFASNLTVNLEPVYGILLAIFILKEHKDLSIEFYIGAVTIVFSVLLYPFLNSTIKNRK